MKCKDCMYYSGKQIHGHGEYFARCQLYDNLKKYASKVDNNSYLIYKIKHYKTSWDDVVNENDDCHIIEKRWID